MGRLHLVDVLALVEELLDQRRVAVEDGAVDLHLADDPARRADPPPSALTPTLVYRSGKGPSTRLYQGLRSTMRGERERGGGLVVVGWWSALGGASDEGGCAGAGVRWGRGGAAGEGEPARSRIDDPSSRDRGRAISPRNERRNATRRARGGRGFPRSRRARKGSREGRAGGRTGRVGRVRARERYSGAAASDAAAGRKKRCVETPRRRPLASRGADQVLRLAARFAAPS